jgi:hypothetical protein
VFPVGIGLGGSPFDSAEGTSLVISLPTRLSEKEGVLPVGIGLRDPRSQTRDLGHPSISPFDIAEGTRFVIFLPLAAASPVVDGVADGGWGQVAAAHLVFGYAAQCLGYGGLGDPIRFFDRPA